MVVAQYNYRIPPLSGYLRLSEEPPEWVNRRKNTSDNGDDDTVSEGTAKPTPAAAGTEEDYNYIDHAEAESDYESCEWIESISSSSEHSGQGLRGPADANLVRSPTDTNIDDQSASRHSAFDPPDDGTTTPDSLAAELGSPAEYSLANSTLYTHHHPEHGVDPFSLMGTQWISSASVSRCHSVSDMLADIDDLVDKDENNYGGACGDL